tara:strand:- start:37835 stop:39769 length:1935 start_codon:yes stop_codon:yes gene_type:complete
MFRICCCVLLAAVATAYWPGLAGPFVLDDFGSIAALGSRGGVVDWETFKAFVFSGNSGPTGRPLSLLTFLLDANNWPAEAWPFKRTNLVIHCLCGAFLGLLIREILLALQYDRSAARWLAIAAAGIWLLHPFLVSTTLYIVQRMAQLTALFSFVGLLVYIRGRVQLPQNPRRAYLLMSSGIAVFGLLATLSKENGILLPLLVAVVEITVIASQHERFGKLNRYWAALFLVAPALVVFGYLGGQFFRNDFFDIVPPRDFSIYERLLTESRILIDYLQHWFLPKLYTTGVFQDHVLKSSGILSPVTTLLAVIIHVVLLATAIVRRRRWPVFALAILFFYASHLLESTVVNLELYFEHRNYLATGFLFLPLLIVLQRKVRIPVFALICVAMLVLLGSFTRYSASIWSTFPSMVEASAHKAPTSARAQAQYSVLLYNAGRQAESVEVLNKAIETIPGTQPLLLVNRLVTLCELNQLTAVDLDREIEALATVAYDSRMIRVYSRLAGSIVNDKCPRISIAQLNKLFRAMLHEPGELAEDSLEYSQVQYLIGFAYAHSGQPAAAVEAFLKSLAARPGASHAMQMAAVLASAEHGDEALQISDIALAELQQANRNLLGVAPVSESDIRIFQETVREDIRVRQAPGTLSEAD